MSEGQIQINPQPVPMQTNVAVVDLPTPQGMQRMVQLIVSSPTGVHFTFMEPDGADAIANALLQAARHARSGLHIAKQVPPPNNGHKG